MFTFLFTMFLFSTQITLNILKEISAETNNHTTNKQKNKTNMNSKNPNSAKHKKDKSKALNTTSFIKVDNKKYSNQEEDEILIHKIKEGKLKLFMSNSAFSFLSNNDKMLDMSICGKNWSVYLFAFTLGAFWNLKHLKKIGLV